MNAGRELDAVIAEKVMKDDLSPIQSYEYRITQGGRKTWDGEPDLTKEGWEEDGWERLDYIEERYWKRPITLTREPKRYSTDISAAFEIVEKLRPHHCVSVMPWGDNYHVTINNICMNPVARGDAKTAPHAICLAALQLLERLA